MRPHSIIKKAFKEVGGWSKVAVTKYGRSKGGYLATIGDPSARRVIDGVERRVGVAFL